MIEELMWGNAQNYTENKTHPEFLFIAAVEHSALPSDKASWPHKFLTLNVAINRDHFACLDKADAF